MCDLEGYSPITSLSTDDILYSCTVDFARIRRVARSVGDSCASRDLVVALTHSMHAERARCV